MRSFLHLPLLIAGALAVFASPASAAGSELDAFRSSVYKRAGDGTYKRGLCICIGGAQNGRAGEIDVIDYATGDVEYLYARCTSPTFSRSTGEYVGEVQCDASWVPLPK